MLLLALATACTGGAPSDPVGPAVTDTGDTGDTGDTDSLPPPDTGIPARDPLPDQLLLPDEIPEFPHWQIRIATSTDGTTWVPDERVIAVTMSSLGGMVSDGRLYLTGNIDHEQANQLGIMAPTDVIYAVSTEDLLDWDGHEWPVVDGDHGWVIDADLYTAADGGMRAVYYATSQSGGDPAEFEGDHEMRIATLEADAAREGDAAVAFAYPYLVDPAICPIGDAWWMFATHEADHVLAARSDDGGTFTLVTEDLWGQSGVTVPSCRVDGDDLALVAQQPGGGPPPLVGRMTAAGTFTGLGALYETHPWGDNCTSPIVQPWDGGWILACAVYAH